MPVRVLGISKIFETVILENLDIFGISLEIQIFQERLNFDRPGCRLPMKNAVRVFPGDIVRLLAAGAGALGAQLLRCHE
jgi:hypothetical protein